MKEILDIIHKTIYQFFDACDEEVPMSDKDKLLLEVNKAICNNLKALEQRWIPVSERLPEYGVAVLTYDGICYCVEKRIQAIRDENGEPIFGEWWVSDDYDESNSEYYPNLRDGACIAWMNLPEPYKEESEDNG